MAFPLPRYESHSSDRRLHSQHSRELSANAMAPVRVIHGVSRRFRCMVRSEPAGEVNSHAWSTPQSLTKSSRSPAAISRDSQSPRVILPRQGREASVPARISKALLRRARAAGQIAFNEQLSPPEDRPRSGSEELSASLSPSIDTPQISPRASLFAQDSLSEGSQCLASSRTQGPYQEFDVFRDDVAYQKDRLFPHEAPPLPCKAARTIVQNINQRDYLAMRATCRTWYAAIAPMRSFKAPIAYRLPAEILQQIFLYLLPLDFESARHTCRTWMFAGMQEGLLLEMLSRGGWSRAATLDYDSKRWQHTKSDWPWALSKRLSAECGFTAGYRGNGTGKDNRSPVLPRTAVNFLGLVKTSRNSNSFEGPNDSDTIPENVDESRTLDLNFTPSACGKFLMVTKASTIYVYRLGLAQSASELQPFTTIRCPFNVVSLSMDTTSDRYAIAAIIEGRKGLVCEMSVNNAQRPGVPSEGIFTDIDWSQSASRAPFQSHSTSSTKRPSANSSTFGRKGASRQSTYGHCENVWHERSAINFTKNRCAFAVQSGQAMPTESGSRTMYRNLCTIDDPPRSVAICPQRKCVAFGCRAGIELHWVDSTSGKELSRWFPLTASSDFLFFLPACSSLENSKKLRLISSTAHPESTPSKKNASNIFRGDELAPFAGLPTYTRSPPTFRLPAFSHERLHNLDCDHFRAVPLSDGIHVLFTDPASRNLFLGCDAPVGGPTKLLRQVKFIGPDDEILPSTYAAGADIHWGIRVVAAYGDHIWLFAVPADVLSHDRLAWKEWLQSPDGSTTVKGRRIGQVKDLVSVAVRCGHHTSIWAFSSTGYGYVWESCPDIDDVSLILCIDIARKGGIASTYLAKELDYPPVAENIKILDKRRGSPSIKTVRNAISHSLRHSPKTAYQEWKGQPFTKNTLERGKPFGQYDGSSSRWDTLHTPRLDEDSDVLMPDAPSSGSTSPKDEGVQDMDWTPALRKEHQLSTPFADEGVYDMDVDPLYLGNSSDDLYTTSFSNGAFPSAFVDDNPADYPFNLRPFSGWPDSEHIANTDEIGDEDIGWQVDGDRGSRFIVTLERHANGDPANRMLGFSPDEWTDIEIW